uniref:FAM21/CAPZIP domain-containing protein n=1 Tax=Amblyomma sculptum TaxID=1581419 RepID=A0A1E1XS17_AMBSC
MNSVVSNGEEGPVAKQWDQPLTTADMRARAADWSLADDSRMLAYLEAFTQSVTARTCEIQKQLESLVYETQVSSVKVNNVINDFNHLSSLQFVENRVYDEEVKDGTELKDTQGDVQQQQPSGDQEAALVVRVSEAFRLGVEVLRSSLEVIDLHQEGDSDDSDEEEGGGRERNEPLLRALDPYLARPLPPLIGSDRFLADDRVGLGELLSEDEADEKSSSHGGEGEEEEESDGSDVDSDLLLAESKKPAEAIDNKMADYMQREFGGSRAESNEDVFAAADREELHSRSSSSSELDSDGDESAAVGRDGVAPKRSTSPRRRTEDGAKGKEDTLFGLSSTEDSPEGEKASPFVRKSGLFSGDGKLFDDDSDEGDLFRDVSAAKEEPQRDLFRDVSTAKEQPKGDLFGDVSTADEQPQRDLFRDVPTAKEQPSNASNPPKLTASGKKIPVGGVSLFGGAALPLPSERSSTKQEAQARSASAGDPVRTGELASSMPEGEDEDSLFGSLKKETPPEKQAAVTPANIFGSEKDTTAPKNSHSSGKPTVAAGGLFDGDDDDDDLWASAEITKAPQQEPSVPFSQPVVASGAKDLLKEEPPPLPKAEGTSGKAWKKQSLFDDEDEDDLLFSGASGTLKTESKPAKSFLFDADDEDFFTSGSVNPKAASHEAKPYTIGDSPATESVPTNKSRTGSRGIFLFEDEPEKPVSAAPVSEKPPPAPVEPAVSQPISLFTAEEEAVEDDEDLFSERTPPTNLADSQSSHSVQSASWSVGSKGEAEPTSVVHSGAVPEEEPVLKLRSGSRFLFDQEDELFKSSPDNNVDVDLFAPPQPSVTDSSPKKKPAGGVSLFGGSSMFGDELRSRLERSGMPAAEPAEIPDELGQEEGDPLFSQSSALQYQSRPALRDTKVTAVSFDEPADQNKTLVSATKGRAKVKVKRRLPSRRKLPADSQDGESGSPPTDPLPSRAPSAEVTQEEPQLHCAPPSDGTVTRESVERDQPSRLAPLAPPQSGIMVKSPSTEEEDLFAVVENSLHRVPEVCQKPNPAKPAVGAGLSQALFAGSSIFDDDAEEDLFTHCAPRSSQQLNSGNEQTNTHGFSDAIFEAGQLPGDSVLHRQTGNSESSSTTATSTTATPSEDTAKEVLPREATKGVSGSIFDDGEEDNDIFAPSAKASSSARLSRRKQDTLFDDETDDIFSSKVVQPKVSKSEKKGSQPSSSSSSAKRCLPRTTDFKDPLLGDLNDE